MYLHALVWRWAPRSSPWPLHRVWWSPSLRWWGRIPSVWVGEGRWEEDWQQPPAGYSAYGQSGTSLRVQGVVATGTVCTSQALSYGFSQCGLRQALAEGGSLGICRGDTGPSASLRACLVRMLGRPCWGMVCWGLMVVHLLTIASNPSCTSSLLLPLLGVRGLTRSTQPLLSFPLGRVERGVRTAWSSFLLLLGGWGRSGLSVATCVPGMLVLRWAHTVGFVEGWTGLVPSIVRASQHRH